MTRIGRMFLIYIPKVFEKLEIPENLFLQMTILNKIALINSKVEIVLKHFYKLAFKMLLININSSSVKTFFFVCHFRFY